ncbi:MAG: hypothetical protein ACK5M4_16590 [Pseudorhodobacter sp.]
MASRGARLALHLLLLIDLLVIGIAVTTLRGDLWPFDLHFSVLIMASSIAVLAIAWWPVALGITATATLLPDIRWRIIFWPLTVLGMVALHAAIGPELGFMSVSTLGTTGVLLLYAVPVALPILVGSALHETFRANPPSNAVPPTAQPQRTPS